MGDMFRKQGVVRMIVIVVALLLVVGLVGGVLAATKTSSGTTSAKTVTSSGSSSNTSNTPAVTRYTLTYSMGSYADSGSVPSPVTVEAGTTVSVNFDTYPSRNGYYFSGWDNSDGAGHPNYKISDGWTTIVMNSDVTLYPCWYPNDFGNGGNQGGGESSISYGTLDVDLSSNGNLSFGAYRDPNGYDRIDVASISGSGYAPISLEGNSQGGYDYYLYIDNASDVTVTFTGNYEGTYYDNVSINLQYGEDNCANGVYFLCDPYKCYSYWTFCSGDSGTLSIVRSGGGH